MPGWVRDEAASLSEAASPSPDNLPPSGEFVERVRGDDATGQKEVHFFGKESFIKQMSRPGRRVLRFVNPATGDVLLGRPYSRPPT